MAITIGTSGLSFGLSTETGGICQSFSQTRNVEKAEVRSVQGDVTGIAYFNNTDAFSLSLATTGSYSVTAGASLAIANAISAPSTIRVDSLTFNKSNDGFLTVDVSATGYPQVT